MFCYLQLCGRAESLLLIHQKPLQARGRAAELINTTNDVHLGREKIAWVFWIIKNVLAIILRFPANMQSIFLATLSELNDVWVARHTNMGRLLRVPPHCFRRRLLPISHVDPVLQVSLDLNSALCVELCSCRS